MRNQLNFQERDELSAKVSLRRIKGLQFVKSRVKILVTVKGGESFAKVLTSKNSIGLWPSCLFRKQEELKRNPLYNPWLALTQHFSWYKDILAQAEKILYA